MKVIWNGPVYDPSGYGSCARKYIYSLYDKGHEVLISPDKYYHGDYTTYLSTDMIAFLNAQLLKEDTQISDFVHIQHRTPNLFTRVKNNANVGYTVWETNVLPPICVNAINQKDIILTPSTFSANTIRNSGFYGNIHVIPHIINMDDFVETENRIDHDRLVFLFNGEFTTRKGIDVLLESYMKAFTRDDDVVLVLKTYILDNRSNVSRYVSNYLGYMKERLKLSDCPEIKVIDQVITDGAVNKLYMYSDVLLSPTRGEGFGLTIAEGLAANRVVVATDKGGHRDFCGHSNSILIDSQEVDIDVNMLEEGRTVYKGQKWFNPSVDHLVETLQSLYEIFKHRGRKGFQDHHKTMTENGYNKISSFCDPDRIINHLVGVL